MQATTATYPSRPREICRAADDKPTEETAVSDTWRLFLFAGEEVDEEALGRELARLAPATDEVFLQVWEQIGRPGARTVASAYEPRLVRGRGIDGRRDADRVAPLSAHIESPVIVSRRYVAGEGRRHLREEARGGEAGTLRRVVALRRLGRSAEARRILKTLLREGRADRPAAVFFARELCLTRGDDLETAELVGKVIAVHPAAREILLLHGGLLARLGRFADAAEELRQGLALENSPWYYSEPPRDWDLSFRMSLGLVEEARGNWMAALRVLLGATPDRRADIAGAVARLAKHSGAGAPIRSSARGWSAADIWVLARGLIAEGNYRLARSVLSDLERRRGLSQETIMLRGSGLLREGRPEAASVAFSRIGPQADQYSDALVGRLIAAWSADDWPEAVVALRLIGRLRTFPRRRREFLQALHRVLVDGGGVSPPRLSVRRREELVADCLRTVDALLAAGRPELAVRAALLLRMYGWREAMPGLVGVFLLRGDTARASRYLEEVADGELDEVTRCDLLGAIAEGAGRPLGAVSSYRKAIALAPGRLQGYLSLAAFFGRMGRKVRGRRGGA